MPLDPRIPLMGQPMQLASPLNMLARAQGVQNMQQQNELNAMQMQDMHAQRAMQLQQAQAMQQARANFPDPPDDAPDQLKFAVRSFKSGLAPFSAVQEAMKPKAPIAGDKPLLNPDTLQPVYTPAEKLEKPPEIVRLVEARDALPPGDPRRAALDAYITKQTTHAPGVNVTYGAPIAGEDETGKRVFFQPSKDGKTPPAIIPGVAPPKPQQSSAIQEKFAQNSVTLNKIDQALQMVKAKPDALGLQNYAGDTVMQRVDPSGVEVRAMIADIGGQKIHDRSGAAVTVGEAARLKPYIPAATDTADTVTKKLQLFRREYAAMQQALNSGASIAQASAPSAASSGVPQDVADLLKKYGSQ